MNDRGPIELITLEISTPLTPCFRTGQDILGHSDKAIIRFTWSGVNTVINGARISAYLFQAG